MIVFRVENKHRMGPYREPALWDYIPDGGHYCPIRPAPSCDGLIMAEIHHYHFGFASVEALLRWFPYDMLHKFSGEGYFPVSFDMPENTVRLGGKQLAYQHYERKPDGVTKGLCLLQSTQAGLECKGTDWTQQGKSYSAPTTSIPF